ncbi:MAG: hypothetical protein ATN31_01170 [Candidatus Epulonipiscioides saccharophilum]|nr:MAG: hypothetical protein ATN31_01170 [Epulopiscium sp. AS2M-Bin001]
MKLNQRFVAAILAGSLVSSGFVVLPNIVKAETNINKDKLDDVEVEVKVIVEHKGDDKITTIKETVPANSTAIESTQTDNKDHTQSNLATSPPTDNHMIIEVEKSDNAHTDPIIDIDNDHITIIDSATPDLDTTIKPESIIPTTEDTLVGPPSPVITIEPESIVPTTDYTLVGPPSPVITIEPETITLGNDNATFTEIDSAEQPKIAPETDTTKEPETTPETDVAHGPEPAPETNVAKGPETAPETNSATEPETTADLVVADDSDQSDKVTTEASDVALIDKVKLILEHVHITLSASEASDQDLSQSAVTQYITTLLDGTGVNATVESQAYQTAILGDSLNPDGIEGKYDFIVNLNDNGQTTSTSMITANIEPTDYVPVTSDQATEEAVDSVIDENESTSVTLDAVVNILDRALFTLTESNAANIEDAKASIYSDVEYILADTGMTASIKGYGFSTALAGTAKLPQGTNGYYKFMIDVTDGEETLSTNIITSTIEANPLVADKDQIELKNLITTLENAYPNVSDISTAMEAGLTVKAQLESLLKDTDITATIKAYEFTPPVAGTESTPDGVNGSYKYSVELKEGDTTAATNPITMNLVANKYEAPLTLSDISITGLTHDNIGFSPDVYEYTLNITESDKGKNFILNVSADDKFTTQISLPSNQQSTTSMLPVTVNQLTDGSQILVDISEGDHTNTYKLNVAIADNNLLMEPLLKAQETILPPLVSLDGTDIPTDQTWVSSNADYAYKIAIKEANEAFANHDLTAEQINSAISALNTATDAFTKKIANGTKAASLQVLSINMLGDVSFDSMHNTVTVLDPNSDSFTVTVVAKNSDVNLINPMTNSASINGVLTFTVPATIQDFSVLLSEGDAISEPITFTVNSIASHVTTPEVTEPTEEDTNPLISDADLLAALAALGVQYNVTMMPIPEDIDLDNNTDSKVNPTNNGITIVD